MTKQEILQKAMEKAMKNGYSFGGDNDNIESGIVKLLIHSWRKSYAVVKLDSTGKHLDRISAAEIIFDHDFCKAFFKDIQHDYDPLDGCLCAFEDWSCDEVQHNLEHWQNYMSQMVLSPDPIEYISKFI